MLSPRLTNCPECANIPELLNKIDCKLAELGNSLYNNISYMLNQSVPASDIIQLIGYRRILQYKYVNPDYLCEYSVNAIAGKVIRLTLGCVADCTCNERGTGITTTSTSTSTTSTSSTTTTTTTIPACSYVLLSDINGYILRYILATNTATILFESVYNPRDLAHSSDKLWLNELTEIYEYDITLSPWSQIFNRAISTGSVQTGNGLGKPPGINNKLVTVDISRSPGVIVELDITNSPATSVDIVTLPPGAVTPGDLLITDTVQPKILINLTSVTSGANGLYQYDYNTGAFEIYVPLGSASSAFGIYEEGNLIYLVTALGLTYSLLPTPPYTVTLVQTIPIISPVSNIVGASQLSECTKIILTLPPTTTTTSSTLSPPECAALILKGSNIYTYDVNTNTSVDRGIFSPANDVANTATKMWFLGLTIEEYNITVYPWSAAFNRNITYNTQLYSGNGLCAKDNVTLITTNALVGFPHPIVSIDISGSTAVETVIGYLPIDTFVTGDLIYTTTGKLIITVTTTGSVGNGPYIIQYDYATMNLEVQSSIPFYDGFGLIEAINNLYILRTGGEVHQVDLNYPYGLTLVQDTGLTSIIGASQTPSCCNVNLIPQSISTTTTTTTSSPVPIECIVYNSANGNIYTYDPLTNNSVEILVGGVFSYFQVANTDTKLWTAQSGGYIQEYDITFSPGPTPIYNRLINTGSVTNSGTFAIDNTTLIIGDIFTLGIYELDITTTTSINTLKGAIEVGFTPNDMLLTTSGKLIIVATNAPTNTITKVYQYDYATWTLEVDLDLSSQLPVLNYGISIAEYDGNIYLFTRIASCVFNTTPSGVYILDPLTNNITLVNSTGFSCPSGASSWLPCNTTELSVSNTLDCVYYTNYVSPYILNSYDVNTNTSTPVVLPTGDELSSFAETHTQNKYWKGNQTSLIREWVTTSTPNVLQVNRNIPVSGITSPFGNYFSLLEAVDDNHLLTIVLNAPLFINTLTLLDITSGTVTASEITSLFNIYAPNGVDSFMLTATNKILAIGRRSVGIVNDVYFLMQYSYPDGALEIEINLSSTLTYSATTAPRLFQSADGNLYMFASNNIPGDEFSTIFKIDLSTPYAVTTIWTNLGFYNLLISSSVNCNIVNLNEITTTTTSTTLAPTGFNTIYTHFEAL